MLDLRFNNLCIISSFVGREQGVAFVEEYDRNSLYPMLIKCHEHLHPLVRSDEFCWQRYFLSGLQFEFFKQIASTSCELAKESVKRELFDFQEVSIRTMVVKTWNNVSYSWIFSPIYFGHCWISNWNRKDFFFGWEYLLT
jgi:hypothetical protein